MIKKGKKLKLTQYIQISKNNDPLSQNLVAVATDNIHMKTSQEQK